MLENTPTIQISKTKAKKLHSEYVDIVKERKEKVYEDLKKVYHAISTGAKVVDIYEVFKQSGVSKVGEPNLAIASANSRTVHFWKDEVGAGRFSDRPQESWVNTLLADVALPSNTFDDWKVENFRNFNNKLGERIARQSIEARVPIVPAHLLPRSKKMDGYYVLFEVPEWEEASVKKADPFLLKRINANAFILLAEWDVTELERAVIRGL